MDVPSVVLSRFMGHFTDTQHKTFVLARKIRLFLSLSLSDNSSSVQRSRPVDPFSSTLLPVSMLLPRPFVFPNLIGFDP